jgi:choline-glycine betaine transporter
MMFGSLLDLIIKFGSITVLVVYLIFALVMIRQIDLMVRTFNSPHEAIIQLLGWVHLVASGLLLILALVL